MIGRVRAWCGMYVTQNSRSYRQVILGVLVLQTFSNYIMCFSYKKLYSLFFGTNKPLNLTAFIVVDRSD